MRKFLLVLSLLLCINSISFAVAFTDVNSYKKQINYLKNNEIINGYKDGTFKPESKITRAEIAKIIVAATKKKNTKASNFKDVSENHWAKEYIDIAVANNYIKGDTEGTYRPEDNITYGEVATILVRIMDKTKETEKLNLKWPLNYMKEAEALKLFEGYEANDLIAQNEARRDSVALMVYNMLDAKGAIKKDEDTKIDTKTSYAGIVVFHSDSHGGRFITVKQTSGKEEQFLVDSQYDIPELYSFIIYKFNSKGDIQIKHKLLKKDVNSNTALTVVNVKEEFVWFKGLENVVDLSDNKIVLADRTIKPSKYKYFILSSFGGKSASVKMVEYEKFKFKKDDKIIYDENYSVCYVIR